METWKHQTNMRNIKLNDIQKERNLQFQQFHPIPASRHMALVALIFENGNLLSNLGRAFRNKTIIKV